MTSSITSTSTTDLTLISGIGPSRQQMLREVLGVESLTDLAALSVDEIETQLKAAVHPMPRSQIESWVEQAQALIATPAEGVSDWQTLNAFVVTFEEKTASDHVVQRRIRVRHEASGTEQIWQGHNIRAAATWMSQFADQEKQPVTAPRKVTLNAAMQDLLDKVENRQSATAAERTIPAVKIIRVRAFQPPDQLIPLGLIPDAQLSPGVIKASQLFKLETEFTVSGLEAFAEDQLPQAYSAQFFVYDRTLGTVLSLGSSPTYAFNPGQATYSVALKDVVLRAGSYRLEVVTRLERQSGAWMGYLEVPILQVVG